MGRHVVFGPAPSNSPRVQDPDPSITEPHGRGSGRTGMDCTPRVSAGENAPRHPGKPGNRAPLNGRGRTAKVACMLAKQPNLVAACHNPVAFRGYLRPRIAVLRVLRNPTPWRFVGIRCRNLGTTTG